MSGAKYRICMASLGDVLIGCDGFNSRYHSTRVCLGLPDSVIDTIKEYGGRGVNFCCTSCRLEGESGSNVLQSGIVVNGSRGLVVGVRDCKEFARCSGYPDKRYETYDGDYWSVK